MSTAQRVRAGLSAAAAWRLAGLLFERPRDGWHEEVDRLSREVADPILRAAARAAAGATEGSYLAVLGPGGTVSPREVSYRSIEDPGRVVAKVSMFYEAFAYTPRAEDPADHIAVEAGFAGYLALKEAYAESSGDAAAAATTADARHRFLDEHLRGFAGSLAGRLEASSSGHLAAAARALSGLIGSEIAP